MITHSFESKKRVGTKGENIIVKILRDNIKDKNLSGKVARIPYDQRKHHRGDVEIKLGRRKAKELEVKTDQYGYDQTTNFFLETISNAENHTKGCIEASTSDFLFYFFINERRLHIFETKKLRRWLLKNMHRFETAACQTKTSKTENYTTVGLKVPRGIVRKEVGTLSIDQLLKKC